jgi:hypothetical protein
MERRIVMSKEEKDLSSLSFDDIIKIISQPRDDEEIVKVFNVIYNLLDEKGLKGLFFLFKRKEEKKVDCYAVASEGLKEGYAIQVIASWIRRNPGRIALLISLLFPQPKGD